MALEKTLPFMGFSANYWRIIRVTSDFERTFTEIRIALYKDEATRISNSAAIIDGRRLQLGNTYLNGTSAQAAQAAKDVALQEAYIALKFLAVIEAAKLAEDQDADLAFFSDATDN